MIRLDQHRFPCRIVCMTDETTETLYLLGESWRIVGVSAHTVRPERARQEKPTVCTFTTARLEEIVKLQPDLVLGFSDLQAEIATELVRRGIEVHLFNHRTVAGILRMIRVLGGMVGCASKAEELVQKLTSGLQEIDSAARRIEHRPRVYFEEWDQPMISGIGWVSELIELAGGVDSFAEFGAEPLAKDRIIADPAEVVRRRPDIIIGSWCGKRFRREEVAARPGWQGIPAVCDGELHEIDSSIILQPGPAALTDGVQAVHEIVSRWSSRRNGSTYPA